MPKTVYDYAMHISGKTVNKSLLDNILMLDEYEHEDFDEDFDEDELTDFSDNDARQPDLFNSTQYKVANALDEVFGC